MPIPTIRVGDKPPAQATMASQVEAAWKLLSWLAIAFLIVGLVDLGVAWLPLRLGTPEWEFGTITSTLNNLPVPAMGLVLLLASGIALERRGQVAVALSISALLVVMLLGMSVFYGLTAPLAWKAGTAAVGRQVVAGAILKAVAAILAYCTLGVICITFALRSLRNP